MNLPPLNFQPKVLKGVDHFFQDLGEIQNLSLIGRGQGVFQEMSMEQLEDKAAKSGKRLAEALRNQ